MAKALHAWPTFDLLFHAISNILGVSHHHAPEKHIAICAHSTDYGSTSLSIADNHCTSGISVRVTSEYYGTIADNFVLHLCEAVYILDPWVKTFGEFLFRKPSNSASILLITRELVFLESPLFLHASLSKVIIVFPDAKKTRSLFISKINQL